MYDAAYLMGTWTLLVLVTVTWFLWAAAALQAHQIGKREGRIRPESGMSVAPVIPIFPLVAFGLAKGADQFASPWGTWVIGGFHLVLVLGFVVAIVWQTVRHRKLSAGD
ncbi:MAG: hypothetical protein ACTHM6_18490 [Tepidisphaeraceae bacterium]